MWATETLEIYTVSGSNDLPSGSTAFTGIDLQTSAGTPSVQWTAISDDSDGITTAINVDGASGAVITITY